MDIIILFLICVFLGLIFIGLAFYLLRILNKRRLANNAIPKMKASGHEYYLQDPITKKVNKWEIPDINKDKEQKEIKKKIGFFGGRKQEPEKEVKPIPIEPVNEQDLYNKFIAKYEQQKQAEEQEKRLKEIEEERKRIEQERIKELERQEKEKAYIEMRNRILEELKQKEPPKEEPKKYYSDTPFKIEESKEDETQNP
jgi:hypothetical protein